MWGQGPPPSRGAEGPATPGGQHESGEGRPGQGVDEFMINVPLPIQWTMAGGADQHVLGAEEDRNTAPDRRETYCWRARQAHVNIFARRPADRNRSKSRVPFITRESAFVPDECPFGPSALASASEDVSLD